MKRLVLATISLTVLLAGANGFAQRMGMAGPPGVSAGMAKFFGNNSSFSSQVEATIKTTSQPDPITMEMNMSMLEGKIRVEIDMSTMKGAKMPPGAAAQMKAMGMDKTITLIRPDKKVGYNIFPNMKAYAESAMSDRQVADAMDDAKIEKTSIGKETIDGHACEKNKVVVTSNKGEKHEVIVWNATDLKDFPVQMQTEESGTTMLMKYRDVKLVKPDAALFEPPAGFTKYDNMQKMLQTEGMKRATAAGLGGPDAK